MESDSVKNVLSDLPQDLSEEVFETILEGGGPFKVERIVSEGYCTPEGTWYDQAWNEWVLLLQGSAGLVFEGKHEVTALKPGDYVHIPAHRRHRVLWTDRSEKTIWLTIHYPSDQNG